MKKIFKNQFGKYFPLPETNYVCDLGAKYHDYFKEKSYFQNICKNLSLEHLFTMFKTDKAKVYYRVVYSNKQKRFVRSIVEGHNYSGIYEKIFQKNRKKIKKIIEIGSLEGGSTAAFHFYFFNATINCLDINFDRHKIVSKRITKNYVDQSSEEQLKSFIDKRLNKNDLDIVIDDGSHKENDILITFKNLFPKIKKGGWYVIEDLSKSWHKDVLKALNNKKNTILPIEVNNKIGKIFFKKSEKSWSKNNKEIYVYFIQKR